MRLDERRAEGVAWERTRYRVILLHGDDALLVARRARTVCQALEQGTIAMFGPVQLDGSEHARALEELESPSLGGGGRVVRLRDAGDVAAASVAKVLASYGSATLLIDAPALPARSRLRTLVEAHPHGLAVLCRSMTQDEAGSAADGILSQFGHRLDAEARVLLMQAPSLASIRHSTELVALWAGAGSTISAKDIWMVGPSPSGATPDDLGLGLARGRWPEIDRALEQLLLDGVAPAAAIRFALAFFTRLRGARLLVETGATPAGAVAAMKPPVFFSQKAASEEIVASQSLSWFSQVCAVLWGVDLACRQTAAPAAALWRHVAYDLVGSARRG